MRIRLNLQARAHTKRIGCLRLADSSGKAVRARGAQGRVAGVLDLTGLDPLTAVIQGSWSTDNSGNDILVNGVSTGNTSPSFGGFTSFNLAGNTAGASRGALSGSVTINGQPP